MCGECSVTLHSHAVLTFIQELCHFFNEVSKYSCCISTAMKARKPRRGDTNKVCVCKGSLKHWVFNSVSQLWIPVHHKVPVWLSALSYWCFGTFHLTLSIKVILKEHLHLKTCSPWVSPAVNWQRWRTQKSDSDYRWPDSPSIRSLSD